MSNVKKDYLKLKNIKNGVILFINNDKILFVRDINKPNKWMLPAGHIDKTDKTLFDGALREFQEETSYEIDLTKINSTKSYIYKHTIIYILDSTQTFPQFNINLTNGETDKVKYILIKDLKEHLFSDKNISIKIKYYNKTSFIKMFNDNII